MRGGFLHCITYVSHGPRFHPGQSNFPSPVGGHSISYATFPTEIHRLKLLLAYTHSSWFIAYFDCIILNICLLRLLCPHRPKCLQSTMCREPLCPSEVLLLLEMILDHPQLALPNLHRYYALMRQTYYSLFTLAVMLWYPVFAGCCKPLLNIGSSQRYFCRSFFGCLTPYPGSLWSAFSHYFLQSFGLLLLATGSAVYNYPYSNFSTERVFEAVGIRFCSNLQVCSPPWLLALLCLHIKRPVTFTSEQNMSCYLPMHRIC